MIPSISIPGHAGEVGAPRNAQLMEQAQALEAAFLSEMLSFSGLGTAPEGFGGGIGEDQFASFLRHEQARLMVEKGGIGLAEQIFRSLIAKEGLANDPT